MYINIQILLDSTFNLLKELNMKIKIFSISGIYVWVRADFFNCSWRTTLINEGPALPKILSITIFIKMTGVKLSKSETFFPAFKNNYIKMSKTYYDAG